MTTFRYVAINNAGKRVNGVFEAENSEAVISMLRQKKSFPVNIEEQASTHIEIKSLSPQVSAKDIAVFCRQVYAMLNAGITIVNCLETMRFQVTNQRLRKALDEVYQDVQKGTVFSAALQKHKAFPELLVEMVEAGETSGTLDKILERMAIHYEKEFKINNKIKSSLVYPIILAIVAFTAVLFLMVFVMPTFVDMFEGSGVELPGPTRILLELSALFRQYWYLAVASLAVLGYLLFRISATPAGKMKLHKLLLRLPVVGTTINKIATARFARTLAILLYSGIPLIQALESTAGVVGNKVIVGSLMVIRDQVRKGTSLADPVRESGHFPPLLVSMIKVGEDSGTLDVILDKTANFYDEEVETSLQQMLTMIEPLMIIAMAVVIGFIVIAIVLPIFDMTKTVS